LQFCPWVRVAVDVHWWRVIQPTPGGRGRAFGFRCTGQAGIIARMFLNPAGPGQGEAVARETNPRAYEIGNPKLTVVRTGRSERGCAASADTTRQQRIGD
jgi:hypothetical protein